MFCYQCQETAQGKGCILKGVCGKTAEVAGLQDLLMYLMKGISKLTTTLRKQGVESSTANKFIVDGLFMTITNANFDSSRFVSKIKPVFNSFIIITMSNEKSSTLVTYIERKLFRGQVHS
jgi:hydroxylamine reductase